MTEKATNWIELMIFTVVAFLSFDAVFFALFHVGILTVLCAVVCSLF